MTAPTPLPSARRAPYDAVVVGARVAGAATALLLARRGLSVLLVDRAAAPGSDTLSTHALMRAGVLQLRRWGLLDRLVATGAPPVRRTVVHYGDEIEVVDVREKAGVGALYAPRRTVLDPLLVAAAAEAGVEVRYGVAVDRLLWRGGRVAGVAGTTRDGAPFAARARLVIGADGHRSLVAREVAAPLTWRGTAAGAFVYGYWPAAGADGYEWFYRPGVSAGIMPTNGGEVCFWVGTSRQRFLGELGGDPRRAFARLLAAAAPEVAGRYAPERRRGRLHGWAGVAGWQRRPWGPGWALVGDAGAFRDPLSAHGMTDALRDAELLADAAAAALGGADEARALAGYERTRDEISLPLAEITDVAAAYRWTLPELRALLIGLSRAMGREVDLLVGRDEAAARAVA
ncbi:MAG TPA: FAD-dependent monooxygenase [Thermoanaerobaculia bacterium]